MRRQVTECPVCDAPLQVTELSCASCDTRLRGYFPPPPLARLSSEHQRFIETFVRCRGIIRDVERALGISYPTVRARLDAAVGALESTTSEDQADTAVRVGSQGDDHPNDARRRDLLRKVEEGLLDPAAAADALRTLRGG